MTNALKKTFFAKLKWSALYFVLLYSVGCTVDNDFIKRGTTDLDKKVTSGGLPTATLTLSESSIDFGEKSIHSIHALPITVTNNGLATATQFKVSGFTSPFGTRDGNLSGAAGCANGIPVAGSCTFLVTFVPVALPQVSQNIVVSYFDGVATQTLTVVASGSGSNVASLQIVDAVNPFLDTTDFGSVVRGSNVVVTKTLNVKYGGLPSPGAISVNFSTLPLPWKFVGTTCKRTSQNSDCTVTISYSATTLGVSEKTLSVTYNNQAESDDSDHKLLGTTVPPAAPTPYPNLVLKNYDGSTPANVNFGRKLINKVYTRKFRVANDGMASAIQISAALSSPYFSFSGNGSFPGSADAKACTDGLAGGDYCVIEVKFKTDSVATLANASVNATLALRYSDGSKFYTVSPTFTGAWGNLPRFTITNPDGGVVSPFNMGAYSVNFPVGMNFTVANDPQSVSGNVTSITTGTTQFTRYLGSCTGLVDTGATCSFGIAFRPDSATASPPTNKLFSDTVTVNYVDADPTDGAAAARVTRGLSGTGKPEALLVFDAPANPLFDQQWVNTTATQPIKINYYGLLPATGVNYSALTGPLSVANVGTGACGSTVTAASAPCFYYVTYRPTAEGVTPKQTVRVNYQNGIGAGTEATADIYANAIIPTAQLSFANGGSFGFGNIGAPVTKTFTINLSGPVSVTNVTLTLSAASGFGNFTNTCGTTVGAAGCSFGITSSATVGNFSTDVQLSYFDGKVTQKKKITLSYSNVARLSFASAMAFGKTPITVPVSGSVTLRNNGTSAAASVQLCPSALPPEFTITTNACVGGIAAGGTCNVVMQFLPTTPGPKSTSLCLQYADGSGATKTVSTGISGSGTVGFQVKAGGNHTCVLDDLGDLYCFGNNSSGQLGLGDVDPRGVASGQLGASLPKVPLSLGGNYIKQIALGGNHSCVLDSAGKMWCWGANEFGQTGNGDSSGAKAEIGDEPNEISALQPVNLGTGTTAAFIAAGYAHTCAITNGPRGNGVVLCFGEGSFGKLGRGDVENVGEIASDMGAALVAVPLGAPAAELALDTGHSCARLSTGAVKCWGYNNWGQLGQGSQLTLGDQANEISSMAGVRFGNGLTASAVAAGGAFTSVIDSNGKVKSWGHNFAGLLGTQWCAGNGTFGSCSNGAFNIPLSGYGDHPEQMGDALPAVDLGSNVRATSLATGNSFSCAITTDAANVVGVKCWGANDSGQLGKGNTTSLGVVPAQMGSALTNVDLNGATPLALTAGDSHVCALTESSSSPVVCWGNNDYGQLGIESQQSIGDQAGEMGSHLIPAKY